MRGVVKHAGMGLRVTVMYVDSNFMYKRGETEQLQKNRKTGFHPCDNKTINELRHYL